MNVKSAAAMQAYGRAMAQQKQQREMTAKVNENLKKPEQPRTPFGDTVENSLARVNELQGEKKKMIEEFASGKNQNVHELMIHMQKAGLAMSMTTAVRNKVMASYQKIMQMPL